MLRAVSASAAAGRRGLSAWSPAVQRLVGSAADGAGDFAGLLSIESRHDGASSAALLIGPSHALAVAPASPVGGMSRRMYSTTSPRLDGAKGGGGDGADAAADPTKEVKQNAGSGLANPERGIYSVNSDLTEEEIEALLDSELAAMEEAARAKEYSDWKPGQRKRPLQMSYKLSDFEAEFSGQQTWTLRDKRCGALGIKVGMMPVWDRWGERHPCTVLYLDSNVVVRNKTSDGPDGYDAVVVGAGERKAKNVNRATLAAFEQFNVGERPPYIVREFRVTTTDAMPEPGSRIHAGHFVAGQNVDISGISKGKGFQGAMKRHGFGGMPATHGTSKSHRALGSTGQCQDPGKVFKGKKMAGRMGTDRVTMQNLRVVKIDRGRNLLFVKGAVPGNKGSFVEVRDAVKKPLWGTTHIDGGEERKFPPLPTGECEEGIDGSGEAGHEIMMPLASVDPFAPSEEEAA